MVAVCGGGCSVWWWLQCVVVVIGKIYCTAKTTVESWLCTEVRQHTCEVVGSATATDRWIVYRFSLVPSMLWLLMFSTVIDNSHVGCLIIFCALLIAGTPWWYNNAYIIAAITYL
eukprot:GHVQ01028146.1.p1 GENE.GHVQ01028146.1~~GHVQ01028146.1.p1  ORF type:complete len:115 (+),score=13.97 GHVQ01028146.1:630-974(+)